MQAVGQTVFLIAILVLWISESPAELVEESAPRVSSPSAVETRSVADQSYSLPSERVASLPSERTLMDAFPVVPPESPSAFPPNPAMQIDEPPDSWERMRPTFQLDSEWLPAAGDVGIFSYGVKMNVPVYPVFGPPPPLLHLGFSQAELSQTGRKDLPTELADFTFGSSWVRRLNDRWTLRILGQAAFASDGENTSGDAWQFRGGLFAMYSRDPAWIWTVGALALGRNDLPAVPALGVIWQPSDSLQFDLLLPRPRIRLLLRDGETRQQWGYAGGGFSGGSWAYRSIQGVDDQLTYGDWRIVAGWETVPRAKPGSPFSRGRKFAVEVGYSFARDIEFESGRPTLELDDTFLIRGVLDF